MWSSPHGADSPCPEGKYKVRRTSCAKRKTGEGKSYLVLFSENSTNECSLLPGRFGRCLASRASGRGCRKSCACSCWLFNILLKNATKTPSSFPLCGFSFSRTRSEGSRDHGSAMLHKLRLDLSTILCGFLFLSRLLPSPKSLPLPQMTGSFSPGRGTHSRGAGIGACNKSWSAQAPSTKWGPETATLPTCRLRGAGPGPGHRSIFLSLGSLSCEADTGSDGCEISENVYKANSRISV